MTAFSALNRARQAATQLLVLQVTKRLGRGVPALIYQVGRVGSKALHEGLKRVYRPVFHVHRMNAENILAVRKIYESKGYEPLLEVYGPALRRAVVDKGGPLNTIVLVREPVARHLSYFFHDLKLTLPGWREALCEENVLTYFLATPEFQTIDEWFDRELKAVFGLDVLTHPFDRERGWQVIEMPPRRFLILKLEMPDEEKVRAVTAFLDLREELTLPRINTGDGRDYGALYRRVKSSISLPADYLDQRYASPYTRHFYTEEEIESFRRRWRHYR